MTAAASAVPTTQSTAQVSLRTVATDGKSKLAAKVADRIVGDVIAGGWPVGEVLGSEAALLHRYGVSRAVFREAVRLLENQQVARMRRGPGGGLVVTEPTVAAITDAVVLWLYRVAARLDEVFQARLILEELVTELAPARLDEADLIGLRELVKSELDGSVTSRRALHSVLASMTRNPALELFVDIFNNVSLLYLADDRTVTADVKSDATRAHVRIVEAVVAGDAGLARHRMRLHLQAEADYLKRRRSTRKVLDPVTAIKGPAGGKRAEEVAREIFRGVVEGRLEPGDVIGSEAQLMDRFGVSRAIVREAVRLLEHHYIAFMRRGPGGGLVVSAPSALAVTNAVALYIERNGISIASLFELRTGVELAVVDLAIQNMDTTAENRLREALEWEAQAPDADCTAAAHDLHVMIAALTRNPALELVSMVLTRLSHLHERGTITPEARVQLDAEVSRTHGGITDALIARDPELTRHRMRRHLEVLAGFLH